MFFFASMFDLLPFYWLVITIDLLNLYLFRSHPHTSQMFVRVHKVTASEMSKETEALESVIPYHTVDSATYQTPDLKPRLSRISAPKEETTPEWGGKKTPESDKRTMLQWGKKSITEEGQCKEKLSKQTWLQDRSVPILLLTEKSDTNVFVFAVWHICM